MPLGDITIPLVEKVFGWAREVNPSQPLTSFHGSLSVNSVSGIVNITDLDLDKLNTRTVSGEITIDKTPTLDNFISIIRTEYYFL